MSDLGEILETPSVPLTSSKFILADSRSRSQPDGRRERFKTRRWDKSGSSKQQETEAVRSIVLASSDWLSVLPSGQRSARTLADHRFLLRLGAFHYYHHPLALPPLTSISAAFPKEVKKKTGLGKEVPNKGRMSEFFVSDKSVADDFLQRETGRIPS